MAQSENITPNNESVAKAEQATESSSKKAAAKGFSMDQNAPANFKNLGEMKTKAPELYEAILRGLAQTIMKDMQDGERRRREILREAQRRG